MRRVCVWGGLVAVLGTRHSQTPLCHVTRTPALCNAQADAEEDGDEYEEEEAEEEDDGAEL